MIIILIFIAGLIGFCLGWGACLLWAYRHRMSLTLGGSLPETVYVVPSLFPFKKRRV